MSEALTTETALEEAAAGAAAPNPSQDKARSLWSDAWRDLRRNPFFLISAVLIVLLVLIAAVPGLFTDTDPKHADLVHHYLTGPNWSHVGQADWFGYDGQGRSVYSRAMYGARASIIVGIFTTLGVAILGSVMGMLAGYYGGWVDSLLSRVTDVFFGIPLLLGAIVVLNAFTHRTVWTVVAAMVFLGWTQITRVMRGSVITAKQQDYVQAARALGAGTTRILLRHILPNAVAPVIVVSTIALGGYISLEATLSFLGIGLPDSAVSWGNDISSAQTVIRTAPHVLFFPSALLSITVLAFIMLGDAVRDALDPKLR